MKRLRKVDGGSAAVSIADQVEVDAARQDEIDVFELDDATGWRAINQTTGQLADRPTPEEARIAVMADESGPVRFAPDHFRRMAAQPDTTPGGAGLDVDTAQRDGA
jgi:hypothetical protein